MRRLEVTPRGGRFIGALTAALLTLSVSPVRAQDAGAQGDPHPGPVAPDAQLPPGHPQVAPSANPHGGAELNRPELPRTQVEERDEMPPGEVEAQVVDARGNPVPEALVRLGSMQGGEPGPAVERRASPNGVVRFSGLATGQSVAYRLSVEREGVRFSAAPFQLTTRRGVRAQLVRYDVSRDARGTLLWDARFELHFRDERITVVQRMRIVNLSAMSLGGVTPEPRAFAPDGGLRFRLPTGYTAFQTAPMMADVRLEEEGGAAVLRGAIAPTSEAPLDVVFQYQLRLHGGDFTFDAGLPLPVVSATVASEAPHGLTLNVSGMPAAQLHERNGDRILVTGVERRPSDPAVESVRVTLGGIPRAAGPAREAAAVTAGALVLAALGMSLGRGRRGRARSLASLDAERDRVLAEAAELARQKAAGEVGPVSYARRRRELAVWLASLLKERDEVTKVTAPAD